MDRMSRAMGKNMEAKGKCPVMHGVRPNATFAGRSNRNWCPNQLKLNILHQH